MPRLKRVSPKGGEAKVVFKDPTKTYLQRMAYEVVREFLEE